MIPSFFAVAAGLAQPEPILPPVHPMPVLRRPSGSELRPVDPLSDAGFIVRSGAETIPAGAQGRNEAFTAALAMIFGPAPTPPPVPAAPVAAPQAPEPARTPPVSLAGPVDSRRGRSQVLPPAARPVPPAPRVEPQPAPAALAANLTTAPSSPTGPRGQATDPGDPMMPEMAPASVSTPIARPVDVKALPIKASGTAASLSLDVVDLEVSRVLQVISEQAKTNLILLSNPQKTLTIRLQNVPLDEALTHVCAIAGLRRLKIGTTYVIASPEELSAAYPEEYRAAYPSAAPAVQGPAVPEARELIVLQVSFTSAPALAKVLQETFPKDELTVVVGPAQHVPRLSDSNTEDKTGVQTGLLTEETGQGGSGNDGGDPNSRIIVLQGTPSVLERAKIVAQAMDRARPQISISVRIIDVQNEALRDLGVSWSFSDSTIREQEGGGFNIRSFDRSPQTFSAALAALQRSDRAKILAEPNISVLDNQRAFILIGQRLNFPTLIGYTQANTPIFSPKEEKVGIYLQVAASVAPNGEITMSLYPQVSTVTGFLEVSGGSYPQIATREAQTTVRVSSGETIMIGGLIRDDEIRNVQKVPFLGDIPILGEFFRKTRTQRTSSQIIISITPTVTPPRP